MTKKHPKLELTWIGKENRPKLEPRILLEDPSLSYHAKQRVTDHDLFDNRLIFGDNLLALKALEQEFAGKVKCVFIDPPYNTGYAFKQYDDGLEHSIWLSLMRDRLGLLKNLLDRSGSLWITIDDNESHYLKVLCDEVFGRDSFIANVIWEKKYTVANDAKYFSDNHDHILVYARDKEHWTINRLTRTAAVDKAYKNPDKHPKGPWKATPLQAKSGTDPDFLHVFPNGVEWRPPKGRYSAYSHDRLDRLYADNELWFGKKGTAIPSRKTFLAELRTAGVVARTVWRHDEVGHNHEAKSEVKVFNEDEPFDTPKPERLLQRILHLATDPGDIVLDSFAGSGTTGAVAHKMGRRWIMAELEPTCHTHIIPRLKQVVDGTDQGGISKAVAWKGGGGFRYFRLAPSLLEQDKWGNWVISKQYNPTMLAEAACKLEGFTYAPSTTHYWMHGHSTERDFIYVTTQHLTAEQLQNLSDEVGEERTLLVLCTAFKGKAERWPNLTVKKIPMAVLKRCEWGHDDYSLNVENLPMAAPEPVQGELAFEHAKPRARKATKKKHKA